MNYPAASGRGIRSLAKIVIKHTVSAKVQMNYHILLGEDNHQYSVPYIYIGKQTQVVYDYSEVEIFINFKRIALHKRIPTNLGYTTVSEHMPSHHPKQKEAMGWDAGFFLRYAQSIGPNTAEFLSKFSGTMHFTPNSISNSGTITFSFWCLVAINSLLPLNIF